jgi:hypothetical protein
LIKLSVIRLFTIALTTGFVSIEYIQWGNAFSIDFSGLPGFDGNRALDFLKGPKGDKGDTGPQGPLGSKRNTGAIGSQRPPGRQVEQGPTQNLEVKTIKAHKVFNDSAQRSE